MNSLKCSFFRISAKRTQEGRVSFQESPTIPEVVDGQFNTIDPQLANVLADLLERRNVEELAKRLARKPEPAEG